jgi:hypothetical protein
MNHGYRRVGRYVIDQLYHTATAAQFFTIWLAVMSGILAAGASLSTVCLWHGKTIY